MAVRGQHDDPADLKPAKSLGTDRAGSWVFLRVDLGGCEEEKNFFSHQDSSHELSSL
jgi:hypothetical protein